MFMLLVIKQQIVFVVIINWSIEVIIHLIIAGILIIIGFIKFTLFHSVVKLDEFLLVLYLNLLILELLELHQLFTLNVTQWYIKKIQ